MEAHRLAILDALGIDAYVPRSHAQSLANAARAPTEAEWDALAGKVDDERHAHVKQLLARQEREAREWRDACLLYFQTFSKRPLPAGVEPPEHPLEYYKAINIRYAPGHPGAR